MGINRSSINQGRLVREDYAEESVGAIVSGLKQAEINFVSMLPDSDLLRGETISVLSAYRLKGVRRRISERSILGRGSYAIHI